MNPLAEIETKQAIETLKKHFKELILIGADPSGNAVCFLELEAEKPFVMHGDGKEHYVSLQYIPSAMLSLPRERVSKLAAVLGGFGTFLQEALNESTHVHVIQKPKDE